MKTVACCNNCTAFDSFLAICKAHGHEELKPLHTKCKDHKFIDGLYQYPHGLDTCDVCGIGRCIPGETVCPTCRPAFDLNRVNKGWMAYMDAYNWGLFGTVKATHLSVLTVLCFVALC